MSSDLDVKLYQPVKLAQLAMSGAKVLTELLRISEVPAIALLEMSNGVIGPPHHDLIGPNGDGPTILFEAEAAEATVGLTLYDIPEVPGYTAEDDVGTWAGITVAATRSPLEYALAASVAVALGRIVQSAIVDNGRLWTSVPKQSPDEFAQAVMIQGDYADSATAAKAFYSALPVGNIRASSTNGKAIR